MSLEYMEGYQDAEDKYKPEIEKLKAELEKLHRLVPSDGTYSANEGYELQLGHYKAEVARLKTELAIAKESLKRMAGEMNSIRAAYKSAPKDAT